MPRLLKKLEEISTTRLNETKKYMQIFEGIEQALYFSLEMLALKSTRALYSFDSSQDIESFVEETMINQGPPGMMVFAFDLSLSSDQIRNGSLSVDLLGGI